MVARAEPSLPTHVRALCDLSVPELRRRHMEFSGRATRTDNRQWLVRAIVRHMTEGRQPESRNDRRALARALDKALAPRTQHRLVVHDPRIPPAGSTIRRHYGGHEIKVRVTKTGFRYEDRLYRSLSAVAREVTGARWNGLLWFGLTPRKRGGRRP